MRVIRNRIVLPLILAAVGASAACAAAGTPTLQAAIGNPDSFTLSGSSRFRYETINGQIRPGLRRDDDIVAIRTTLLGEYHRDGWRIGGEIYDSRVYGAKADSAVGANDVNAVELVQAYAGASFDKAMGKGGKGSIEVGRFIIPLGSRRLSAADEYRNTATAHTGIRIDLARGNGAHATLFYVLPQVRLPDDMPSVRDNRVRFDRESFDLRFWGALLTKPRAFGTTLAEFGYFGLAERDAPGRPNRNRHLHTADLRLLRERAAGSIDYEIEAVYQFGTVRAGIAPTAPLLDVSAWFVHAGTGYSLTCPIKARISIEYDYASGDGPGRHFGRFDTLFGMRRADFSPSGLMTSIGRANISSPGIRIEANPTSRLDGHVSYRAMWLADRHDAFSNTGVQDATGRSGSFAGHQIDMRLRYWLVPQMMRFELNADLLMRGSFLKYAPNAPAGGDLHYVSTALTTSF
jgi:hypothetical protein